MDRIARLYAAAAAAVTAAAVAFCWLTDGLEIYSAIVLVCLCPLVIYSIMMWLHGTGYKSINGLDWRSMTEQNAKEVASKFGFWMLVSMAILLYSTSVLMHNLALGLILMGVGIAVIFIPLASGFKKGKPVPSGTPSKKAAIAVLAAAIAIVPPVYILSLGDSASVDIAFGDDGFSVRAPMFDHTFEYDEIDGCSYYEDFDKGVRKMGYGTSEICSGHFKNDLFGDYELASYTKVRPCIAISVGGEMYAFNQDSAGSTLDAFEILKQKLPADVIVDV